MQTEFDYGRTAIYRYGIVEFNVPLNTLCHIHVTVNVYRLHFCSCRIMSVIVLTKSWEAIAFPTFNTSQ